jgi:hypothetical protein
MPTDVYCLTHSLHYTTGVASGVVEGGSGGLSSCGVANWLLKYRYCFVGFELCPEHFRLSVSVQFC